MSEQEIENAEGLLERITRKERYLNKLFWVLIGSIVVMVGSVSALTNSQIQTKKDIEYVRANAFNRIAAEKLVTAINVKNASVQKLIEDEDIKQVVKYFDDEMAKVTDDIISWNSAITPRGAKQGGTK